MSKNADEIHKLRAELREAVEGWTSLTADEWERGGVLFQPMEFAKGDLLTRAGEPSRHIFFLCSGLTRMFYSLENGKEMNKSFAWEGLFVSGSLGDAGRASEYGIQALEDTTAMAAGLPEIGALMAEGGGWTRLRDLYLGSLAERKARRERQLLVESAEERYRTFLTDFPHISGRLPQYQIALYLGITEVALSRIKKRMFGG